MKKSATVLTILSGLEPEAEREGKSHLKSTSVRSAPAHRYYGDQITGPARNVLTSLGVFAAPAAHQSQAHCKNWKESCTPNAQAARCC